MSDLRLTAEQAAALVQELKRERKAKKAGRKLPEARMAEQREALTPEAGAMVLGIYDHEESLRTGRRVFRLPWGTGSTADAVEALVSHRLLTRLHSIADGAIYEAEDDRLQVLVNGFLIGHGLRLRAEGRNLGLGNQSKNRTRTGAAPREGECAA